MIDEAHRSRTRRRLEPLLERVVTSRRAMLLLSYLPARPRRWRGRLAPPRRPWPSWTREVPAALRTVPGIRRDRDAEQRAFDESPLHDFRLLHHKAFFLETAFNWPTYLMSAPRLGRANRAVRRTRRARHARRGAQLESTALTAALRREAAELGVSAIGIAPLDAKYTYSEYAGCEGGDRVVVLVIEQHDESTQTIPSLRANRAANDAEADSLLLAARVARFLHRQGYRAHAHTLFEMAMIPYAVEAGLGQLGINGQLLTPYAGSRSRLAVVTTEAPLDRDQPVDYGVPAVCDACQICARRCPAGAIRTRRAKHRGVEKAKVNLERCFPTVLQGDGCAVCTKVCPVQKFGLEAVLDEFERTGNILGKGTDELEAYHWPPGGYTYRGGERPRLPASFIRPNALDWDPSQLVPYDDDADARSVPDR
jgi:ferredoxin